MPVVAEGQKQPLRRRGLRAVLAVGGALLVFLFLTARMVLAPIPPEGTGRRAFGLVISAFEAGEDSLMRRVIAADIPPGVKFLSPHHVQKGAATTRPVRWLISMRIGYRVYRIHPE